MTEKGIALICSFEGFRSKAYQDSVGVWTIGYGSTYYKNGTKVKKGDKISKNDAIELMNYTIEHNYEPGVEKYITSDINPYQKDALTSFAYNVGVGNLKNSTLLKKVNANPNDLSIKKEFLRWNKAGGKVLSGLTKRRKAESELYFTEWIEPVLEEPKKEEEKPIEVKYKSSIFGMIGKFFKTKS